MLYYTNDSFRPNFGRHDRYIHALPKAEKLGCAAALSRPLFKHGVVCSIYI